MLVQFVKVFPNILTFFRLIGAPALFFLLWHGNVHAFTLFVFLVVSDFFDGKIARRFNAVSIWGEKWDPVADKLLVLPLLVYFWHQGSAGLVPVMVIWIREGMIIYFRGIAYAQKIRTPSLMLGKLKMVFESLALGLFLLGQNIFGNYILWAAAFFATTSLIQYMLRWPFVLEYCLTILIKTWLLAKKWWSSVFG